MQIKVEAQGRRKQPVKQVVSPGTPRQFHKFLSWLEVNGRNIAVRLYFLKRLLDEQHNCTGVLGQILETGGKSFFNHR